MMRMSDAACDAATVFIRMLDKHVRRCLPMMECMGVTSIPFTGARFLGPADPVNGSRIMVSATSMGRGETIISISTMMMDSSIHEYSWMDTWATITYTNDTTDTPMDMHEDIAMFTDWLTGIINSSVSPSTMSSDPAYCTLMLRQALAA